MTAFADLDAVADMQPPDPRYGRMLIKTGNVWGYPGAYMYGTNIKVPDPFIGDARVKAAISAGAYSAFEVDAAGQPVKVVAADGPFGGRGAMQPAEVGSAKALSPIGGFGVSRGNDQAAFDPMWLAAWNDGITADPTGGNLEKKHLVLRVGSVSQLLSPPLAAGDVIHVGARAYREGGLCAYRIKSIHDAGGGKKDLVLDRFLPAGTT